MAGSCRALIKQKSNLHATGAPSSRAPATRPCHGVFPSRPSLLLRDGLLHSSPTRKRGLVPPVFAEKMPLPSICNRLIFMGTPRPLNSRASGLAPFRPSLPASRHRFRTIVRRVTRTRSRRRRIATRASPTPNDDAIWRRITSCVHPRLPLRVSGFPGWDRHWLCRPWCPPRRRDR